MAVLIVFVALTLAACLIYAGGVEIERRTERWERYEKFIHPPDSDDGITLMEDNDENR